MRYVIQNSKPRGIALAVFFFLGIFILIIVSLVIKFIFLYEQSTFDGQHTYNLFINKSPKTADVISFAPDTNSIRILHIVDIKSIQNVGVDLAVFPDGWIHNISLDRHLISPMLFQVLTHFSSYSPQRITVLDIFRLYLFSRTVSGKNITTKIVSLNQPEEAIVQIVTPFVTDNTIYHEGESVAIVNATDSSGVGSRLAKLLTNMGVNIISVTTASQAVATSRVISTSIKTYTTKKLHNMLGFPVKEEKGQSIADDIIILGKDSLSLRLY